MNDEYLTSRNTENLQVITHVQDLEKDEALQDLEKVDLVLMNPPFDRIPKFSTQALKIMKEGAVFLLIGFKRKSPIQYLSLKQELMITKPVYVAGTRINFPTYLRIMMKESVVSLFSSSTELIKQEIKPLIVEQKKLMVRRVNTQVNATSY